MVIFKMIFFRHWQKKNNVIITRHCSIVTRHCVILTWHGGIITRHCVIVTRHCSIVTWHCVIITRHCVTIETAIFCLMNLPSGLQIIIYSLSVTLAKNYYVFYVPERSFMHLPVSACFLTRFALQWRKSADFTVHVHNIS